jgi:hypothetical protein
MKGLKMILFFLGLLSFLVFMPAFIGLGYIMSGPLHTPYPEVRALFIVGGLIFSTLLLGFFNDWNKEEPKK